MRAQGGFENHGRSRTAGMFLGTLGVLLALFAGTDAYVIYRIRRINVAASDIAINAAPSIAHLAAVRAALQETLIALDDAVEAPEGSRVDLATIRSAHEHVDDEVRAYLELPVFEGEGQVAAVSTRALGVFDAALEESIGMLERGNRVAAREYEKTASATGARAAVAIMRVIEFNAQRARDRADEIERSRESAVRVLIGLDSLSAALAVMMTVMAMRNARAYERRMRGLQRDAEVRATELDQFAVRLAHDVKGPLTAVSLELEALLRHADDASRTRAAASRGRRAVVRVASMIDGLLQFARSGAHPEGGILADPRVVIEGLLEELAPEANEARVEIVVEPAPAIEVGCETGLLAVMLGNLVRNALKYMGNASTRRVTLRVIESGSMARFEVEDTGPGVPASIRNTLFHAYVRGPGVRVAGLGLGLATVERICEAHGGHVGFRPANDQGSVFWFELPIAAGTTPRTNTATSPTVGNRSSGN